MSTRLHGLVGVLLGFGLAGAAYAQVIPQPGPPTPIACAYNATPTTLTTGQAGWVQCNNQGALQVNASFTPAGTQDINIMQVQGAVPSVTNPLWIQPGTGATFAVTGTFWQATQPVSNAGTFAVQATLTAETTKVIGTVNQGTSPWVVSGTVTANAGTGTFATSNAALALAQGSTTSGQTGPLIMGAVTTSAPSYTTAQTSPLSLDTGGALRVNVVTGGGTGGTSSTFGAAFPATGTAIGATFGGNMVALAADASSYLKVNCTVGCAGGSFNNNADNVATSATNGEAAAWAYVWDGSAWDRLYGDSTNGAFVNVKTSVLPTGASTAAKQPALGTAGTASADIITVQGIASMTPLLTTTTISGTVTVTGAGGTFPVTQSTSPWIVAGGGTAGAAAAGVVSVQGIASMTPVQVSQATAANLNATVVGNGTFVVQATLAAETTKVIGTVNQGTSPWIVAGGGTAGSAATGVVTIQGIASMTKLLVTPDSVALPANQSVNVAQINGVTTLMGNGVTGTGSQRVTIASDNTANSNPWLVSGAAASGATAAGNPVAVGGLAVSAEAVVTAGQAAALITDLARKLIVLPYANPENFVSGVTTSMTGTTSTSLVAAPASGLRNYITACTFSNAHATVGTDMTLNDGNGGSIIWTIPAAAVYGGAHITFPTPLRQPTTATALFVTNVTTGASTKAACSGYKGA